MDCFPLSSYFLVLFIDLLHIHLFFTLEKETVHDASTFTRCEIRTLVYTYSYERSTHDVLFKESPHLYRVTEQRVSMSFTVKDILDEPVSGLSAVRDGCSLKNVMIGTDRSL